MSYPTADWVLQQSREAFSEPIHNGTSFWIARSVQLFRSNHGGHRSGKLTFPSAQSRQHEQREVLLVEKMSPISTMPTGDLFRTVAVVTRTGFRSIDRVNVSYRGATNLYAAS